MHYKLTDIDTVAKAIIPNAPVAFDTETKGKYGRICLAQFYQKGWPEVLMIQKPDQIKLMAFLAQLDNKLVMQNASYDITTIQRQLGMRFIPKDFDCTLLMARVAMPSLLAYSLDNLMTVTLGHDPYKQAGLVKKDMQKAKWDVPVIPHEQLLYASIDCWFLLDVYEDVLKAHKSFSYQLDIVSLREALDFQNNGMRVDMGRLEKLYGEHNAALQTMNMPINVNSYQQVRPYIGSTMSDGLGLATLALKGNERAAEVRIARSLIKLNSFMDKFQTNDGKIYGVFGPYARSGRYTCSDQNLQQLPRKLKQLFTVDENRFMLYSDFSQLELRSIAAITGDMRMVQVYRDHGDIHNLVRDMLRIDRQISKTVNFNALYGGGAGMLSSILIKDANILMQKHEVAAILKRWKNLFSGVAGWQQKGIRDFQAGRLGSTACGRKYAGNLMTDQLNIENQGTGAEVAKLAMHYMYPDLKANDCNITNFVHDSYIIDAPQDEQVICKMSMRMAEAMKEAWTEVTKLTKVKDIPMPVKVLGGYNWGDIEAGSYTYKYEVE